MPFSVRPPSYRAFLLRFWQEKAEQSSPPGVWRFSLEDPHTGERQGFLSLEVLVAFLRTQIGGGGDSNSEK